LVATILHDAPRCFAVLRGALQCSLCCDVLERSVRGVVESRSGGSKSVYCGQELRIREVVFRIAGNLPTVSLCWGEEEAQRSLCCSRVSRSIVVVDSWSSVLDPRIEVGSGVKLRGWGGW
jgi:hypothetical protein